MSQLLCVMACFRREVGDDCALQGYYDYIRKSVNLYYVVQFTPAFLMRLERWLGNMIGIQKMLRAGNSGFRILA